MKTRIALWAVATVVVLGVAWTYAVPVEWRDRACAVPQRAAWDALVGAGPERKSVTWPGMTVRPTKAQLSKMAKTAVTGDSYGGSLDICWRFPDGSDQGEIWIVSTLCGPWSVRVESLGVSGGGVDFRVEFWLNDPAFPYNYTYHVDYVAGGIAEARIPITWSSNAGHVNCVSTASPIGEKGATHAKEQVITETWHMTNVECAISVGGHEAAETYTGDAPLSYMIGPVSTDDDRWDEVPGYVVSFENVMFCGQPVDLSAVVAQNWPGYTDKWVEGTSGGTLGLWGHTPGDGHYTWNGCTVGAPYSYDFSGCIAKWMSGANADSLACVCTGLRKLSTQEDVDNGLAAAVGKDIGPWTGTLAELKALGRVTQKYGIISLDAYDPDMQGTEGIREVGRANGQAFQGAVEAYGKGSNNQRCIQRLL